MLTECECECEWVLIECRRINSNCSMHAEWMPTRMNANWMNKCKRTHECVKAIQSNTYAEWMRMRMRMRMNADWMSTNDSKSNECMLNECEREWMQTDWVNANELMNFDCSMNANENEYNRTNEWVWMWMHAECLRMNAMHTWLALCLAGAVVDESIDRNTSILGNQCAIINSIVWMFITTITFSLGSRTWASKPSTCMNYR